MPEQFTSFLTRLGKAIREEDGLRLAVLLKPTSADGQTIAKDFRGDVTRKSMSQYQGSIEHPWDEVAIQYVLVVNLRSKNIKQDAFKEQCSLVSFFLRYFQNHTGWTLPALFSILRDLRDLASEADLEDVKQGKEGTENMEEAARIISKAFSNCVMDRISPTPESRKWGVYYVVGLILKSYFRVKRISLSKNILRAIDANPDIPPLSQYPRSHQVTYRYYIGMLSFLNEDFAKAEEELTIAFYNCHKRARRNHQRILTYLIPLRMFKGHLPSKELLQRFPVLEDLYTPFITAIRTGDIRSYDACLDRFERRLVDLNLWLTLEKARELCIRELFRRVWIAAEKSTRIPVSMFHAGLRVAGSEEFSVDEAECLVANMIYKGFMRGYISHEKQMVVIAKVDPFPRLADRPTPFALLQ